MVDFQVEVKEVSFVEDQEDLESEWDQTHSSVTPFIEIPTSRNGLESMDGGGGMANTGNTTSSSSGLAGGSAGLQNVLNNTVLSNATP